MHKRTPFKDLIIRYTAFAWSPVAVLAVWEAAGAAGLLDGRFFPRPSAIIVRFAALLFSDPQFILQIMYSLKRLALGAAIAIPLGTLLGVAMGLNRKINAFLNPLVAVTYPVPKLAILPLLMLILGIGDTPKIAIIFLGVFYLVLLSTLNGVRQIPRIYFDIAAVYHIPFSRFLSRCVLKGVLIDVLDGCKIGVSYGLIMMVAGEFVAARNGIGFFMWNAWDQFRIKDLYVALLVLSLMGVVIFAVFEFLKGMVPWYRNAQDEHADRNNIAYV